MFNLKKKKYKVILINGKIIFKIVDVLKIN